MIPARGGKDPKMEQERGQWGESNPLPLSHAGQSAHIAVPRLAGADLITG